MTEPLPASSAPRGTYAKSERRRAEIIAAATAEFAARGYHGGSLRRIARGLGVSLTVLQHHFGSKDALLVAVLEDADGRRADWFREQARAHGVAHAVTALARVNLERPEMLRLLASVATEASTPGHPAHGWFVDRYASLVALLAGMIAADPRCAAAVEAVTAPRLARLLVAAWDGLQLQWLLDPSLDMADELELAARRLLGSQ